MFVDRRGGALHDVFVSTGLDIHANVQDIPRTIFADPEHARPDKCYDEIAWFTGSNGLPSRCRTRVGDSSTSRRTP